MSCNRCNNCLTDCTIASDGRIWCAHCGTALDVVFDRCPDYNEDGFLYDRPDPLLGFGNGMTEMANAGHGSYMGRQLHHQAVNQRDRTVLQGAEMLAHAAQRLGLSVACRTTAQLLFKELLVQQEITDPSQENRMRSRRKLLVACLWTALTQFPTEAMRYTREAVATAMNCSVSDLQEGCRRYGLLQRRCQLTPPRVATPQTLQEEALERCQLNAIDRTQAVQWLARATRRLNLLPLQTGGSWAGLMALGATVYGWPLDIARCAQIAGVTVQTAHRHYLSHVKKLPELFLDDGGNAPENVA